MEGKKSVFSIESILSSSSSNSNVCSSNQRSNSLHNNVANLYCESPHHNEPTTGSIIGDESYDYAGECRDGLKFNGKSVTECRQSELRTLCSPSSSSSLIDDADSTVDMADGANSHHSSQDYQDDDVDDDDDHEGLCQQDCGDDDDQRALSGKL